MHRDSTASGSHAGGIAGLVRWAGLSCLPVRGRVPARQSGQAALEAALTAAIAIMTILVTMQLSLIAAQQFSASHVARGTARWLAVRMDTIDSAVVTQAQTYANGLPGLSGGGMSSVTVSPSCIALTGPSPGTCAGRDTGVAVTVTVNTSLTPVMFLPNSFGVAPFVFTMPTSMSPVSYTVLLE